MRRRSGCPSKTIPKKSYASRSCHSAVGYTPVTDGTVSSPSARKTRKRSRTFRAQRQQVIRDQEPLGGRSHAEEVDPGQVGEQLEGRLVAQVRADLGDPVARDPQRDLAEQLLRLGDVLGKTFTKSRADLFERSFHPGIYLLTSGSSLILA